MRKQGANAKHLLVARLVAIHAAECSFACALSHSIGVDLIAYTVDGAVFVGAQAMLNVLKRSALYYKIFHLGRWTRAANSAIIMRK